MSEQSDKWRELAKRDDVLDQMVPSDVRQLVGDIDRAEEDVRLLENSRRRWQEC